MAIAFGAAANNSVNPGTSVSTGSITVSGSNTYGICGVLVNSGDNITGVTWNSVAMTQIAKTNATTGGGGQTFEVYMYGLVSPTTGVVTATASGSTFMQIDAGFYTGVASTGTEANAAGHGTANSTSLTTSVTTITNNAWTVMVARASNGALAASTGSTSRGINLNSFGLFDSNAALTPAGSKSMAITYADINTGDAASTIIASLKPFVAANSGFLMFM